SDYAKENKISKDSAGRELRLATEAGLLQTVRYPQGEAGFRASQGLLREIAEGFGQPVNAAAPLTAETIIGSLAVGQTEGTVTIMFTDVEESTRLLSTRGFTASHEIMKAYETIIEDKVSLHAGRRIKGLGDGFMISFGSSRHGVECALDIQQAITEYSKQNPERKLRIRIGLNTGEVVEEGGDIFGAAVNVAARVAGKAKGGEILVSEIVRQLVGPIAELTFDFRGRYKLKGFPDRWRLHEVTPGEVKEAPRVLASADGFVDRKQERLDIRMVLDRAATGSGSLVFLTGAPGVGASRLATEVAGEAAAKGWLVLRGRCLENDGGPYGPFRDVLTAAVAATPAKALLEAAGDHGPLLATLAPSLRQKARSIAAAHEVPADKIREQLFKAVHEFLSGIQGAKPLLILLDNLQWADEATVLLLRDLALRINSSRMLLIATYWDTELDSGRPFATTLSRLLRRRRAQRMLVAAGIIGRDFDVPLLEAFGELSGHELRDALDEATRGHFLVAAGKDTYRFAHDLVRQRVLAALPLPRLQAYHLAVADTLERMYAKSTRDHAAEIGYHLYQAGTAADGARTATYLAQAAANALSVGAFEEALRLVDSTLQLLPADRTRERAQALADRATALWGLARLEDAKAAWRGAIQRYDELGDGKASGALHRRIAHLETHPDGRETNGSGPAEVPATP